MSLIKYAGLQLPNTNLAGIILQGKPWVSKDFDLNTPANWDGIVFDPVGSLLGTNYAGITSWNAGVLKLHITEDGIVFPFVQGSTIVSGIGLGFESSVKPSSNAIFNIILPYTVTFGVNCSGSYFSNFTNPSSTVVLSIQKNNTQFATCSVNTSGVATFSSAQTICSAGDKVSFVFPIQNSSWSGITVTLKGTRSL